MVMWRIYTPTIWSVGICKVVWFLVFVSMNKQIVEYVSVSILVLIICFILSMFCIHFMTLVGLTWNLYRMGMKIRLIRLKHSVCDIRILWKSRFMYEVINEKGTSLVCLNRGHILKAV